MHETLLRLGKWKFINEVKAIHSYISDALGVWDERGPQACLCSNSVLVIIHFDIIPLE